MKYEALGYLVQAMWIIDILYKISDISLCTMAHAFLEKRISRFPYDSRNSHYHIRVARCAFNDYVLGVKGVLRREGWRGGGLADGFSKYPEI